MTADDLRVALAGADNIETIIELVAASASWGVPLDWRMVIRHQRSSASSMRCGADLNLKAGRGAVRRVTVTAK